jgi:hypothetical protein
MNKVPQKERRKRPKRVVARVDKDGRVTAVSGELTRALKTLLRDKFYGKD